MVRGSREDRQRESVRERENNREKRGTLYSPRNAPKPKGYRAAALNDKAQRSLRGIACVIARPPAATAVGPREMPLLQERYPRGL